MGVAIETKGLVKSFGDFTAVDGIDICVREGTINGFIGPNGAGKSTTMKMLIGALTPTGGSGAIMGHPIGSMDAKKLLGYSPEAPRFYSDMSAIRYLRYMGMICGLDRSTAESRGWELLKWLDIEKFGERDVQGFSAGMKQKLSLAQSLIHQPEVLILDEPTANLDPAGRMSIIQKLKELSSDQKTTVFISSHVLGELEKLVTEVTMINHGKLVATKEVSTLEREVSGNRYVLKTSDNAVVMEMLEKVPYVEALERDENDIIHITSNGDEDPFRRAVTRVVLKSDVWLEIFDLETANLEGLFMKLVGEGEEDQRMNQKRGRGMFGRLRK